MVRQWSSFNNYSGLTPNRFNKYEITVVEGPRRGEAHDGFRHFVNVGIGKVVKAFSFMIMTDLWGDIPYSEAAVLYPNAADAELILNPSFDSRASIYTEVFTLLNEANILLSGPNGGLAVGSDDVIYGGNTAKWLKAIKAIEARGHLHQGNDSQALAAAKASFASPDDNMSYTFPASRRGIF